MPLNPEEVVNKRFSPTKFRQGYDEEEVDEFLDEVVAELRRLNSENDELRAKLRACESRVAELSRSGGADRVAVQEAPRSASIPVVVPTPTPAPQPLAPVARVGGESDNATGMLALAQKLHDEHVEAGKSERHKIINEAQDQAARLVREAEAKRHETLGDLEQQRQMLERKVEQLRSFEREYRSRLKAYLEGQLRDLESKAPAESAIPEVAGQIAGPPTGVTQLQPRTYGGDRQGTTEAPRFPFGG
ncbi:MAG: DivIVA domain-containing protein [Actinomycetota bacterium]